MGNLNMATQSRTYPAFPIPAVGAILLHDDQVLLIQRGTPPAQGLWTLPGGAIEVGESPEEAVIREIREECQLEVTPVCVVEIVNKVIRDERGSVLYHYVILDYLVQRRASQREHAPQPASDVSDVRWVSLNELAEYDLTEGAADVIHHAVLMQQAGGGASATPMFAPQPLRKERNSYEDD